MKKKSADNLNPTSLNQGYDAVQFRNSLIALTLILVVSAMLIREPSILWLAAGFALLLVVFLGVRLYLKRYGFLGIHDLLKQDRYDDALELCNQRIQQNPKNAEAWQYRGRAHAFVCDDKSAIADYNKALTLNPALGIVYSERASSHIRLNNLDEALTDLEKVMQFKDKKRRLGAKFWRAMVYYQKYNIQAALDDINAFIEKEPRFPHAYLIRGNCFRVSNRLDEALSDFNHALKLNYQNAGGYWGRGAVYSLRHEFDKAATECEQALELSPEMPHAHHLKGWIAYNQNDPDTALDSYQQAIELNPKFTAAHADLGHTYAQLLYDWEQGLTHLNTAIDISPDDGRSHTIRAQIKSHLGDREGALADCRKALESNNTVDDRIFALSTLANLHSEAGDTDTALNLLNEALELAPDNIAVFHTIDTVYATMGQLGESLRYLEQALAIKVDECLYARRGIVYLMKGQTEQGIMDIQHAAELDDENTAILAHLAHVHLIQNNYDEAMIVLNKGMAIHPDECLFAVRGQLHFLQGAYDKALVDFQAQEQRMWSWQNRARAGQAVALFALGETNPAINLWQDMVTENQQYIDVNWVRVQQLWATPLVDTAQKIIQQLHESIATAAKEDTTQSSS